MLPPDLTALVRQTTALAADDKVAVIADAPLASSGVSLAEALRGLNVHATLVLIPEQPVAPPVVLEAVRSSQVAVFFTRAPLLHTRAVIDALRAARVRTLDMSGLSIADALRLLPVEPHDAVRKIADFLTSGRRVKLHSDAGTRFEFDIESGALANGSDSVRRLPLGQVRVLPKPGTGTGTIVAESATLTFENGTLVDASDPELMRLDEAGRRFSLMTIGAHPSARRSGNPAEERLVYGQATIALGSNLLFGGTHAADAHHAFAVAQAGIEVDSRPLPEPPSAPEPEPRAPRSLFETPEMYRQLFNSSNEALYIMDYDSQLLLEANPAFEKLVGFPREEIVGTLTASRLVAPESLESYAKRRALRHANPSDRYELRIVARDKSVKPVELSVRLIDVAGRSVVVGAMRDLSDQKRLQEAAWEKIEEIIKANSRMGIMKEKLEKMQELMSQLFNIRDEKGILETAGEFLRDRSKLGYQNVNFYLLAGDALELAYSTGRGRKARISLDEDNTAVKVLHGETKSSLEQERIVMPLKGVEQNIGVIELFVPPKEMETLAGSPAAMRSYQNIAQALANMLGLSIENVRLYDKLLKQSILDPLVPTFNRRYLDQKLDEEFKRAVRYKRPLSVLMIDVNSFARINNTMGHRQGDVILQEIGAILNKSTREVDVVARYGGDEFVIVMPETAGDGARAKAVSLYEKIAANPFTSIADNQKSLHVTVSIGAVGFDEENTLKTPEEMVRRADELMYAHKRKLKKAEGREDTTHR